MRIKLHEVELNTGKSRESREFYEKKLGLKLNLDEDKGLNVFDSGWPGLDFNTSVHRPGKTIISFITDDLPAYVTRLRESGIPVSDPKESHLGLLSVSFEDPDGHLIVVQGLTEKCPPWLIQQFGV